MSASPRLRHLRFLDQLAAVKQILRDQQVDDSFSRPARGALSRISHAKNRMESRAAMLARRSSYRDDVLARVYDEYVKTLASSGALDFDDLLLKTVELFDRSESVRNHYSSASVSSWSTSTRTRTALSTC